MADTYTVFVLRNGELVETTGTGPATPGTPVDGIDSIDDVPGLVSALGSKSDTGHRHTVADVDGIATPTATGSLVFNAASPAVVAGIVEPYLQEVYTAPRYAVIYCPGDVDKPRNDPVTGTKLPDAPACIVLWRKATFPTVGGVNAQNLDDYRPWDG